MTSILRGHLVATDLAKTTGYENLAIALVKSAVRANDVEFLRSEWCLDLLAGLEVDAESFLERLGFLEAI